MMFFGFLSVMMFLVWNVGLVEQMLVIWILLVSSDLSVVGFVVEKLRLMLQIFFVLVGLYGCCLNFGVVLIVIGVVIFERFLIEVRLFFLVKFFSMVYVFWLEVLVQLSVVSFLGSVFFSVVQIFLGFVVVVFLLRYLSRLFVYFGNMLIVFDLIFGMYVLCWLMLNCLLMLKLVVLSVCEQILVMILFEQYVCELMMIVLLLLEFEFLEGVLSGLLLVQLLSVSVVMSEMLLVRVSCDLCVVNMGFFFFWDNGRCCGLVVRWWWELLF